MPNESCCALEGESGKITPHAIVPGTPGWTAESAGRLRLVVENLQKDHPEELLSHLPVMSLSPRLWFFPADRKNLTRGQGSRLSWQIKGHLVFWLAIFKPEDYWTLVQSWGLPAKGLIAQDDPEFIGQQKLEAHMNQFKSVQRMLGWLLAIVLSTAIPIADGDAATIENFTAKTTADLIALCNTDPSQSNYVAAIHFCEGFAIGAYQYYLSVAADSPTDRFVCLPNPPPSRDSVKAAFVAWAQAHPGNMTDAPVNSLFRYLGETYPCPAN